MSEIRIVPYSKIEDQQFSEEIILSINNLDFASVTFINGRITFTISNCDFNKITIQNSESIDFKDILISFDGCIIEDINIDNIMSNNIAVLFSHSIVSGTIRNENLKSIQANNCILKGFYLSNQNSIFISYTEENIFPRVWKKLFSRYSIKRCSDILKLKQSININDSKLINFSFNERESEKRGLYIDRFHTREEWKIGYYLTKEQKHNLNIILSITYSYQTKDIETKINGALLNSLSISGHSSGNVSVENTKIDNWYMNKFSSQAETSFYDISPQTSQIAQTKIEFRNSNFERTSFENIDFNRYQKISIYRTKFGKAAFSACNFPVENYRYNSFETLENVHYPDKKRDDYHKYRFEMFLQLKLALENTGNYHEAQKMQALSNDELKQIKNISGWDRFILCVNSCSNNHGLSIERPLRWFLISSIIFYILYLYSLKRIFIHTEFDPTLIGYYFSFIDLTHRSDFLVEKIEFNCWSLAIDFTNKVLIGFLIYQFISSFRKYGKK